MRMVRRIPRGVTLPCGLRERPSDGLEVMRIVKSTPLRALFLFAEVPATLGRVATLLRAWENRIYTDMDWAPLASPVREYYGSISCTACGCTGWIWKNPCASLNSRWIAEPLAKPLKLRLLPSELPLFPDLPVCERMPR